MKFKLIYLFYNVLFWVKKMAIKTFMPWKQFLIYHLNKMDDKYDISFIVFSNMNIK